MWLYNFADFFSSPVNTLVSAPRCHTQTPKTLMPIELSIFSLKHSSLRFSGTTDGWWHHPLSTCSTWKSQELFFFPIAIILLSSSSVEYSSKWPLCICLPASLHRFRSSLLLCSLLHFHSLPASRLYNKINSVHGCRVFKIPILTSLPQYKLIITFFLKSFYFRLNTYSFIYLKMISKTKVCIVRDMVLPVVMYGCESWTINKVEHWKIDAFEL